MSKPQIFSIYIAIDLAIIGGVVWCFFRRIPAREFIVAVIVLFCLNGLWLIWMTLRSTPQNNRGGDSAPAKNPPRRRGDTEKKDG